MRVADGDVIDRAGGRWFGKHAGERLAGRRDGGEIALVIAVQRALQRLGELPVARIVVAELAHQRGDGSQVDVVREHVLIEHGDVHAPERVRHVGPAVRALAQIGRRERGRAFDVRVRRGLDVHGEVAVAVEIDGAGAVGVHERDPVVERVRGFDRGAVGAVEQAFGLEARAGAGEPAEVDLQFDLAALRGLAVDAALHLEPGGAPGGAPDARDRERFEFDLAGAHLGEELAGRHRFAGVGERPQLARGERGMDIGLDALTHDAVASAQLLLWQ